MFLKMIVQNFKPQTREELSQILIEARKESKKVYATSGSSSKPITDSAGYHAVSLQDLECTIQIDNGEGKVVVGVAVSVKKLQTILANKGLCLPCQRLDTDLTVGEALNSCLHTTGAELGLLATYVEQMEVMTSAGQVVTVTPDSDEELFCSLGIGLGMIGVMLAVTLTTARIRPLLVNRYSIDTQQLLEHFEVHCTASEYFSCTWMPYGGQYVRHCKPDAKCLKKSTNGILRDLMYTVCERAIYWISRLLCSERLLCRGNKLLFYLGYGKNLSYIDQSGCNITHPPTQLYYTQEWFVTRSLVPLIMWELETLVNNKRMPVHRVDVSLVKQDDLYLSPATGRESAAILISISRSLGHEVVFGSLFTALDRFFLEHGARHNWTSCLRKDHQEDSYIKLPAFISVRRRVDPTFTLMSPYLTLSQLST